MVTPVSKGPAKSSIHRVGFFHFGSDDKDDPIGSFETEIAKWPKAELTGSLIVLPEGFDARKGYYEVPPDLDHLAMARLQGISAAADIVLVVGLVESVKGMNSAYLIDGISTPVLLSCKCCGGRDCLYTPSEVDTGVAVVSRGDGVVALICDDANLWTEQQQRPTMRMVERLKARSNVLCIPAYMTNTDSLGVAGHWKSLFTAVVVANGCRTYPSVMLHGGEETLSERYASNNKLILRELNPRADGQD